MGRLKDTIYRNRSQQKPLEVEVESRKLGSSTTATFSVLLRPSDLYMIALRPTADGDLYYFKGMAPAKAKHVLPVGGEHDSLGTHNLSISWSSVGELAELSKYSGGSLTEVQQRALALTVVVVAEASRFTSVLQGIKSVLCGEQPSVKNQQVRTWIRRRFKNWAKLSGHGKLDEQDTGEFLDVRIHWRPGK